MEQLDQRFQRVKATLESNYEEQNKTRVELQLKIKISRDMLALLKKKSAQALVYEPLSRPEGGTSDKNKAAPVDFTILLGKLRAKIKSIHVAQIGHGEVESKPTLQLLNVSATDFESNRASCRVGNREPGDSVHSQRGPPPKKGQRSGLPDREDSRQHL